MILSTLLLGAITALGAQVAAADSTELLSEITVTESVAKVPLRLLPMEVKVIGGNTIENSAETNLLPVLQNRVPGMFITERGVAGYGISGGAAGSVSIRGVSGGNRVLFMIDGQPQWAGVFGHALPDTYVTNDVERVEVVSGPSSILYGAGAMGGSVNLITRRADREGFSGSLSAMGGSYATQKYGTRASYSKGAFHSFAATSYESTRGHREGMNYWLANQYASVSYDITPRLEAGVNGMVTETRADNPGEAFRKLPLEMWAEQLRATASVYLKNRFDFASGGIQAYFNWGKHDIDDGLDSKDKPRTYLFHSIDRNMGFTLYQTIRPWTGAHLSLGADLKRWGGFAYNKAKADGKVTELTDSYVNEAAVYALIQQDIFDNLLNLNAGLRREHSTQFGNEWVPQAGFIVRPMPTAHIKANYSKGFRSPSIRELYMYQPKNPDLLPERLDNYEIELANAWLGRRLNTSVSLFYIEGENMIQKVMVDGAMKNVNTGRFRNRGVECSVSYLINRHWNVEANYAFLNTDSDAPLLAAPRHKTFGEVTYTGGGFEVSLDAMSIVGLKTEKSTENYTLLNARAAYTVPYVAGLTLFAKGENLTAARYQINYGFPMPGATVYGGVKYRF